MGAAVKKTISLPPDLAREAEAVPFLAGGEAVLEDARQQLRRDAHALIRHLDPDALLPGMRHLHGQQALLGLGLLHGVPGIADEVGEHHQHLVGSCR